MSSNHGYRNPYEDERDEQGDPLPKDANGKTINPTQAAILKAVKIVADAKEGKPRQTKESA